MDILHQYRSKTAVNTAALFNFITIEKTQAVFLLESKNDDYHFLGQKGRFLVDFMERGTKFTPNRDL